MILNALTAISIVAVMIVYLPKAAHVAHDAPPPAPIYRELACKEDEDIVITLDSRNLPIAICMQRIER